MRRQANTAMNRSSARVAVPLLAALALLASLLAFGCGRSPRVLPKPPKTAGGTARLLITRDFGDRVLLDKTVRVAGESNVLDVVSKNAKVETAYGGGFVNSINGLTSGYTGGGGSKYDWLYSVNGVQASVGAGEYRVREGDSIWWDYHSWSFISSVPAAIGSYPEPFLRGYGGAVVPVAVAYADGFAHDAGALRDSLLRLGVRKVTFEVLRPGMQRPTDRSVILIGTWKQLSSLGWVADAAANPGTSGVFVRFAAGKALPYDCAGRIAASFPGAGAILATGEAGRPSVAWLVTGVDRAAVRRASYALTKQPKSLAGKFGVVIDRRNNVVAVPRAGA